MHQSILVLLLAVCGGAFASQQKGVVSPIITCGGAGFPIEVRVTDCTVPPCELYPGRQYLIETDFIPSQDSDELSFNMVLILPDGQQLPALDVPVPESGVIGGEFYTLAYPIVPQSDLAGRTFDIQIRLYDTLSQRIEICVRAPATIMQ